jgi:GH15 family glucan-1,4-alpha-glucosidase
MASRLNRPLYGRSVDRVSGINGYKPIEDYAAIGDGRTVALVGRDGSIDWLCLPDLDSPSVFGAVLDADKGGRFVLAPEVPYTVDRRYLPETNVLETTFATGHGVVRVTDVMTVAGPGLLPGREVARRVEGLAGEVPMRWYVEPRFGYGLQSSRVERRAGIPVALSGGDALAVCSWGAGDTRITASDISGEVTLSQGQRALIALVAAQQEPLVLPSRGETEARLDHTIDTWRSWMRERPYDGPWSDMVRRSALALALLVHAPSGALAAAATCSLPEEIGGERNWDYRFCWVRDSAFIVDALLTLGCAPEANAFFWWLMQASQVTRPRLQVLYRLNGGSHAPERVLPLSGYRGSRPVRVGNDAVDQVQLDVYGDVMETAWLYASSGNALDRDIGQRLARTADFVCQAWREPDAGMWEVRSGMRHFTHSKMMCWVALNRAVRLAEAGYLPSRGADRWRAEARAIRRFVERECWSEREATYVRFPATEELDAGVLLGLLFGFHDPRDRRFRSTSDAVLRDLTTGPFVHRYGGDDGLSGVEGAFIACSFWLVEALVRTGRREEAATLMERLLSTANDVGLYSEEIDPSTGAFLGNFPQALTHLALIRSATAFAEAEQ